MGDLFGVAESPFELDEWQTATGIQPDLCMIFESWSRQRSLADSIAKAQSFRHKAIMVTWEPWEPTPYGLPNPDQGAPQPEWSNQSIVRGDHDDYIDMMARCFRDAQRAGPMTVFLRWGHEMNGGWYPWSAGDPADYVAAWKYLRNRIRTVRNAWNVQMVWSPNPDLWRATPADWLARLLPYWPGASAVDLVGFTMIEFGGDKHYPVSAFADRFRLARQIFAKQVIATEVNVAREDAVGWLGDLAAAITSGAVDLPVVVLSQGPSRAAASGGTGDLGWSAATWPEGRDAVVGLSAALHVVP